MTATTSPAADEHHRVATNFRIVFVVLLLVIAASSATTAAWSVVQWRDRDHARAAVKRAAAKDSPTNDGDVMACLKSGADVC